MKTALIVDDSRLARTVLSRLLAEHGVASDEVASAEAALGYLKERRPDVVFLDHNMPGMDGLQALEAIKANPVTATIPVMMYTSQEGQVYLGQARALGAMGVLPKSLRPVEVTKVLRSLHLIPGEPTARPAGAIDGAPSRPPLDSAKLKELIEELFYEQNSVLREEIRKELKKAAELVGGEPSPPPRSADGPFGLRAFRIASALLLTLAVVLGALYYETRSLLDETEAQTERLATDAAALQTAAARAFDTRAAGEGFDSGLLEMLEWAANRGNRYAFGAIPLDEERALDFASLFDHLERIGFSGTVAIDVHVGRHCMNYGADGTLLLAPPEQRASDCEALGWPETEALAIGSQQSVAFANVVAAATRSGRLHVETFSHGAEEPAVQYPLPSYDVTAAEWNAVAASNQRINVRLLPDSVADVQPL